MRSAWFLGARYEAREGVAEGDFLLKFVERGGAEVGKHHFTSWRNTGLADRYLLFYILRFISRPNTIKVSSFSRVFWKRAKTTEKFSFVSFSRLVYSISGDGGTEGNPTLLNGSGKTSGYSGDIGKALHPHILKGWPHQILQLRVDFFISDLDTYTLILFRNFSFMR